MTDPAQAPEPLRRYREWDTVYEAWRADRAEAEVQRLREALNNIKRETGTSTLAHHIAVAALHTSIEGPNQ